MPTGTGRSTGAGTTTTGKRTIPFDVLSRLAQQSTDAADFERRKQQWLDQQDALGSISNAAQQYPNRVQLEPTIWVDPTDGTVYDLKRGADKANGDPGDVSFTARSDADSKRYLASKGVDLSKFGGAPGNGGQRLASDDPRYWQLQYDQLNAQLMNSGLDAESARRQALATIIANRNNTALGVANTSADVAKQAADYAANPRDAYAEAYYANQVGGSTPFGDLHNSAFGEYGKTLAEKGARIFSPVQQDLQAARGYRDSIAPVDFLGSDQRAQLGLQPTPAQSLTGDTGSVPAGATPPTNILQQMTDRLKAMSPEDQASFQKYVTADQPKAYGKGGQIDVGNLTRFGGDQPSSSEGGTNMNIHEPAVLIGLHSGRHYATVAENGYPEQIKIIPTPSGKKAAMEAEKAGKAQKDVMGKAFGTGGTIAATPDDLQQQYTQMLQRLSGEHGGGGSSDPFGGTRQLAGAISNEALINPRVRNGLESTYSAMGISPEQLWSDIKRFTPTSPRNNVPQVSFA